MIAASSLGSSFGRLANYLGGDAERVGWIETRNLEEGKDWGDGAGAKAVDWREAAAEMSDEVVGRGVEQPVYHVAIAFDPDDYPTEAEVRAAADRTLRDLGLEDHQALVVRHTDRGHAHVHLMVNRVGPDGHVWSPWRERLRLRASVEAQERELGLRWTGKNRDLGREPAADPRRRPPGRPPSRGGAADERSRPARVRHRGPVEGAGRLEGVEDVGRARRPTGRPRVAHRAPGAGGRRDGRRARGEAVVGLADGEPGSAREEARPAP